MFRRKEAQGLRVFNTIFFLLMVAVNIYAEVIPLNKVTTAEISAQHDTMLTPPGFTFVIWGIIYTWLLLFILFQNGLFLKKGVGDNPDIVHAVSAFFIISSAANIGWIIAWHYDYIILCFALIFTLWVVLLFAYLRLKKEVRTFRESFLAQAPFSAYLAWISIAMTINFMGMLKQSAPNLAGISETAWTIVIIIGLFLFVEFILFRYRDFVFALTAVWAFFGIFYRYFDKLKTESMPTDMLLLLSIVMAVLFISLLLTAWMQHYKPNMT